MTTSRPTCSVVMPCYDQVEFVEEAVRSVVDQPVAVELIVLDPGSRDGSRDVLRRLADEYGDDRVRLVFEPDGGQSDAVNRGMARATGDVLGWLNSDDRLRPGALAPVVEALGASAARGEPSWLYGDCGIIDAASRPTTSWIARYKRRRGRRFSRWKLLTENFIPQMAVFWSRALWDRAGELDVERELDMDYDLWLRFAKIATPTVLGDTLADFRVHGGAKGSRQTGAQLDAALVTARRHAGEDGWRGGLAVAVHRALSWRTRVAYRFLKPR